jgi:hypothetical protein
VDKLSAFSLGAAREGKGGNGRGGETGLRHGGGEEYGKKRRWLMYVSKTMTH